MSINSPTLIQSTIWWAARANHVPTIEEDEAWFKRIASEAPTNASVHHVAVDRGTRGIAEIRQLVSNLHPEPFDVVVIDGHLRRELVCFALEKLSRSGAVISTMLKATGSTTRRNGGPFRGLISTGLHRVSLCDTAPQYYSTEILFCLTLKSPSSIWKGSLFLAQIESKKSYRRFLVTA